VVDFSARLLHPGLSRRGGFSGNGEAPGEHQGVLPARAGRVATPAASDFVEAGINKATGMGRIKALDAKIRVSISPTAWLIAVIRDSHQLRLRLKADPSTQLTEWRKEL